MNTPNIDSRRVVFAVIIRFVLPVLAALLIGGTVASAEPAQPNTTVEYPGVYPGAAQASITVNSFELQNNVMNMGWQVSGNNMIISRLTDKAVGSDIQLSTNQLFTLTMQDGTVITPSSMTLNAAPALTNLVGNLASTRLSERDNGKQIKATFAYNSGGLSFTIDWYAILHDGSNNVKYSFVINPISGVFNLKYAKLIDVSVPNAQVVGQDNGQTVTAGNVFLGIEHPMSVASVAGNQVSIQLEKASEVIQPGDSLSYSASIGIVPNGQMRRGFLYYLERDRIHLRRPFISYVSWFDLVPNGVGQNEASVTKVINTFGNEMVTKRGYTFDSFLLDDPWDDTHAWPTWSINSNWFPNGFAPLKAAAANYGSHIGAWYSPFGGYGNDAYSRIQANASSPNPYQTNAHGFMMSDPGYYESVKSMSVDMVQNQGVNIFKIDGIGGGLFQEGPDSTNRKDYEYLLKYALEMRQIKPDVWLNVTTGTWSSPYWYWFVDSVYRDGHDQVYALGGNARQRLISGRDDAINQYNVLQNMLHPISELMSHGFVFTSKAAPTWEYADTNLSNPKTAAEAKDDMKWYFASGFSLQEMYISVDDVNGNQAFYDQLAHYWDWAKANNAILADTRMIGSPGDGGAYGYASWSKNKAFLAIRNPYGTQKTISIDPQTVFQIPQGEAELYKFKEIDGEAGDFYASSGFPITYAVEPYKVLVFEVTPTQLPFPTFTLPIVNSGASIYNAAKGIIPTASSSFNNIESATDGDMTTSNHADSDWHTGLQWLQLDLGRSLSINKMNLWHYFGDSRTYKDVIVQVSNTADFSSSVTTLFNNDTNNSAGLGVGQDAEYSETSLGKTITFNPVNARYVRLYSNGSTVNGSNHYVEVQVWTSGIYNAAEGILPTFSNPFLNPGRITDSDMMTNNYADSNPNNGLQWIQLDLGKSLSINKMNMWHYFGDSRKYKDVIVQVSNTADFSSGVTTVFNNDTNNSAGLGTGQQAEYLETSAGKTITFNSVNGRYVRLYSNGSTGNSSNHYVEVQVWTSGISITVDGTPLSGFNPNIHTYEVELPAGTTTVPKVAAVVNDPKATTTIQAAISIPGTTTVMVMAENGSTNSYVINFTFEHENGQVAVQSITVTSPSSTIDVKGGTLQFVAAVLPANATNKSVTWAVYEADGSNLTDKAAIDTNGLLTALKNGTVSVLATAIDGSGTKGSATITISGQSSVVSISVNGEGGAQAITIKDGTLQMHAAVLPAGANNVTWSIWENDGVTATNKGIIDANGVLTAKKDGIVKVVATATDGSGIQGSNYIIISGQTPLPTSVPQATLTGPALIQAGASFFTNFGLSNVSNSVSSSVYAVDMTLSYDANAIDFVSVEPLKSGFNVVQKTTDVPGQIRMIAVSEGEAGAITTSGDVFKFNWIAKPNTQSLTVNFELTNVDVSNALSQKMDALLANLTASVTGVDVPVVDKTTLQTVMNLAQSIYDRAVEGTQAGQYTAGTKAVLLSAIQAATAIYSVPAATQQQLDEAAIALNQALQAFNEQIITDYAPGDINGDNAVDIGDLGKAAVHYWKTSASSDWNEAKSADFNGDGKISISDIVGIAKLILR